MNPGTGRFARAPGRIPGDGSSPRFSAVASRGSVGTRLRGVGGHLPAWDLLVDRLGAGGALVDVDGGAVLVGAEGFAG